MQPPFPPPPPPRIDHFQPRIVKVAGVARDQSHVMVQRRGGEQAVDGGHGAADLCE